MLSAPIEHTISATGAILITDIFLALMLVVFFCSAIWKKNNKHHAFTIYTPTLLTSLGILGTFMGIVAGLLEFDTTNIDSSIGPLLDGLKTAFITSLAGMMLSIFYKGIGAIGWLTPKTDDENIVSDEISVGDIYLVMSNQAQSLTKLEDLFQQQAYGLENLQKAIGGDSESSLVGQFKLMRSDINDNQRRQNTHLEQSTQLLTGIHSLAETQHNHFKSFEERLWLKLQDFADMMSKSATEQVIEALKSVIQDFNNNLTEQFGENFKQLNAAVLELVTWQENYKQQLSDMKIQYDQGVQAITKTETSVAHIGEKAQTIPVAMDTLVKVMEVNQHQIEELSRHLNAFEQVRDKAVEAVPEIRSQIDQAIAGAREANETMAKGVIDSTDQLKVVVMESADNYRDAIDRTRSALDDAATTTANSSVEIKEQFRSTIEDINNNLRNLSNEMHEGNKAINSSFREATREVENSTTRMISTFGSSIDDMQQSLAGTIKQHAEEHRQQADRIFAGLESSIEKALKGTGESVQKQVQMIDKAMETEIERVMQSMGAALASISGQFTQDYSRLTKEMSKVVNQRHVA